MPRYRRVALAPSKCRKGNGQILDVGIARLDPGNCHCVLGSVRVWAVVIACICPSVRGTQECLGAVHHVVRNIVSNCPVIQPALTLGFKNFPMTGFGVTSGPQGPVAPMPVSTKN